MLTRVLFVLLLICTTGAPAWAEDPKVKALGVTEHEVTQAELETGGTLPVPRFNTGAIAYVWAADLKKGDSVEIALVIGDKSLLHNTETLAEDQANYLLQAGKRGVPAGGWPEGHYHAELKITRDGKPLIEQSSTPVAFE